MKIISLIIFFFIVSFTFHKYYFGFAEMEYVTAEKKVEATLIFSAHDLEQSLIQKKCFVGQFENVAHDSLQLAKMEKEIFEDFIFYSGETKIPFKLVDFMLTRIGLINLFIKSSSFDLSRSITIVFKNLMEEFPSQQNKITFSINNVKHTAIFLPNKNKQTIEL